MGEYFNGRIKVSKTSGRGSIPLLPVYFLYMFNKSLGITYLVYSSLELRLKFFTFKIFKNYGSLLTNFSLIIDKEDLATSYIIFSVLILCVFAMVTVSDLLSFFVFLELAYSCVIINLVFQGLCVGLFLHVFAWILLIICISGLEAALVFVLLVIYFGKHGNLRLSNSSIYSVF